MKLIWKTVIAQIVLLMIFSLPASACAECRALAKERIFDQSFWTNLFVVLLPIVLIAAVGIGLYFKEDITDKFKRRELVDGNRATT